MSSHDRPEGAASAPTRAPEAQPTEPRGGSSAAEQSATGHSAPTGAQSAGPGGRRHQRRRQHRTGGGESGGGREQRERGEQRDTARTAAGQPERELNLEELRELSELLNAQGFNEFEIEREGFRLRLSRHAPAPVAQPVAASADTSGATTSLPPAQTATTQATTAGTTTTAETSAPAAEAATPAATTEQVDMLTSPIVGTFYRSPSPDALPFVEVGSRVTRGQVVCIIEAMKLMNEIESDWDGVVAEIYPQNAAPVQFGEPLFAIKPA
ncbi:MAG TPA: acetyl-CoA carboxylase biotin carboxyl carrier protein [Pyrinomonadaceae bacterium]|jgi:acetyl-CoA carboxylase biotin carboxyl carrier protein